MNYREEEGCLKIKALQKQLLDIRKQKTEECEVIICQLIFHLIRTLCIMFLILLCIIHWCLESMKCCLTVMTTQNIDSCKRILQRILIHKSTTSSLLWNFGLKFWTNKHLSYTLAENTVFFPEAWGVSSLSSGAGTEHEGEDKPTREICEELCWTAGLPRTETQQSQREWTGRWNWGVCLITCSAPLCSCIVLCPRNHRTL